MKAPELYRGMDRAALDVAYHNRGVVPDWQGYLQRWQTRSEALYRTAAVERDLRYGSRPRQRFDLFRCGVAGAPCVLFLHGGYWQWNDKEGQAFVASGLMPHDLDVAVGEYTLAPAARVAEICAEAGALVRVLSTRLAATGGGPLLVSGISTGAHLMALTLAEPAVRGALLISGVYDLEPIRISSLNDAIGMTRDEARDYSPIRRIPPSLPPVTLAHGATELPEIRRQSADYAAALSSAGHLPRLLAVPQADHFSVLETLADPAGLLACEMARMAREAV